MPDAMTSSNNAAVFMVPSRFGGASVREGRYHFPMKQFVQALSGRAEFLIVVLGSLGLSLLSNLQVMLDPGIADRLPPFTNETLVSNVIYELFVLVWLGAFMRARGWTLERLGF